MEQIPSLLGYNNSILNKDLNRYASYFTVSFKVLRSSKNNFNYLNEFLRMSLRFLDFICPVIGFVIGPQKKNSKN